MLTLIERPKDIYLPDGTVYRKPAPATLPILVGREYNLSPPASVNRMLHKKFGSNIFGEPRYRVIWGWQRIAFCAGEFDVYSDDGSTWLRTEVGIFQTPKYDYLGISKLERWMLEKWVPAEDYGSPEDWAEQTEEICGGYTLEGIGPYPSRGEYELSIVLEEKDRYLGLTEEIVSYVCQTIERSREIHQAKRRQRLQEEQAKKEESYRNLAGDIWDDARVAFNGVPNSTQANAPTPKPKGRILQFVN